MTVKKRAAAAAMVLYAALGAAGAAAQAPLSPREALGALKAGNDRFARNASSPVSLSVNRRQELAIAQHPIAMVLSCADSRVPPEFVFNAGLGELFVIRTAGEVIDRSILATLDYGAEHLHVPLLVVMGHESYGAEHLHVPLLVVMGHESCGAVRAAAESTAPAESPNLDYLLKAIQAGRRAPSQDREQIRRTLDAGLAGARSGRTRNAGSAHTRGSDTACQADAEANTGRRAVGIAEAGGGGDCRGDSISGGGPGQSPGRASRRRTETVRQAPPPARRYEVHWPEQRMVVQWPMPTSDGVTLVWPVQ